MLILTEKPSVAVSFAHALGVPRAGDYWENEEYRIVNALGHLLENYAPEDYNAEYRKWKLEDLPVIPDEFLLKPVEKTAGQLGVIKKCFEARKDDVLLLATDAEREGELIGAEILQHVGFTGYKDAKRFWVSEALTKEVVLAGIKNAKPLSEYAAYRGQGYARQCADWLTGMNITRLATLKSGNVKLLAFGRVQTAVLGAIYEREKAFTEFRKEKYIEVKAVLKGGRSFSARLVNPDNPDFPSRFSENANPPKEAVEKIKPGSIGKIKKVETEKKIVAPPQLFNLTALQKEAHKAYSYSPEQTLGIAQALYEKHKCLSYPRTPSRVMGDENVELVEGIFGKLKAAYPDEAKDAQQSAISRENKRLFTDPLIHI
jgi:DNA topoisomerase-3